MQYSENHPAFLFLMRIKSQKFFSQLTSAHLPELFTLVKSNMPKLSYQRTELLGVMLIELNRVVTSEKLQDNINILKEYYDMCFLTKGVKNIHSYPTYLAGVEFLNEFSGGQELLKKYGINLEKGNDKLKEALFHKYLTQQYKVVDIKKLQQFAPREIDSKFLLDNHLSLPIAKFLNNNGIEIEKKYLQKLAQIVFNKVSGSSYQASRLTAGLNSGYVESFTDLLLNNSNFSNYIAPSKDIHLAIYQYFDKVYPMPKEYKFSQSDLMHEENIRKNFVNEFSKKLYNNPGYSYINISTKIAHKVNLKYSGTKFVQPQIQEENLKQENALKGTTKRKKI